MFKCHVKWHFYFLYDVEIQKNNLHFYKIFVKIKPSNRYKKLKISILNRYINKIQAGPQILFQQNETQCDEEQIRRKS